MCDDCADRIAQLLIHGLDETVRPSCWIGVSDALRASSDITKLVTDPNAGSTLVALAEAFRETKLHDEVLVHASLGVLRRAGNRELLEAALDIILATCSASDFDLLREFLRSAPR